MNAIEFVIRTPEGAVERGSVGGEGQGFLLAGGAGNDISLNIGQSDLRGYDRAANDLLITLADGRVIVLEDYFSSGSAGATNSRLFISANGELNEVSFVETEGGVLFAQYGPTETWGKWSPSDSLIFIDDPEVVAQGVSDFDGEGEEATMLAALPLLGLGGAGAGGLGALLGLPLLVGGKGGGGGDGGDGSSGDNWIAPTVDNPDESYSISGNDDPTLTVTGTANRGSVIEVVIGDDTVTATAGEDRTWEVIFTGPEFPDDGSYEDIDVTVTDPNGTVTDLDGPSFVIDTTPPAIDITDGTVSLGDIVNAVDHSDGVTIIGTGEPGAELTVTIGTVSETVIIGTDGAWSFTFDDTVFPEGEYVTDFSMTATDAFGNSTTVTDQVQIDTVNMVALDNVPLTGDDLISAAEHAAGVTLSGTTQPGNAVSVVIAGVTQTATADSSGAWSVTFGSGDLAPGTYTATADVTATDAAGNVSTTSHSFDVDTEQAVTIDTSSVAVDGVVNGAEYGSDVTVTGTGEAGSAITVTSGGLTLGTTTVAQDGTWTLDFSPSLIDGAPGHSELGYTGTLTATAVDAAGNTTSTSGTVTVDRNTSLFASFDDADFVVNASERAAGVTLTGGAEPGATIAVAIGGQTLSATADNTGAWSVTVPPALIPKGVGTLGASVTATDLAGNTATQTVSIAVDTQTAVTVNTATVEGDGVVNATEAQDGFVLTGNAEPGARITGTVGAAGGTPFAIDTVANANGTWSVTVPAASIPAGETALNVAVTSTDVAGNSASTSGSIAVDTLNTVTIATSTVETDGVINFAERADGVVLTGTTQPGSSVQVTLGNVTHAATVAADGTWSANFAAAEIPTGETTLTASATSVDAAGNAATASGSVEVDTFVRNFALTSTPGGADGVMNAAEVSQGLTLTGTTEPGGAVRLTLNGQTVNASVDASGNWTASFASSQLPTGETTTMLTAVSTDRAGNTQTITQNVVIDTDAGRLTIDPDPVETDDVVNFVEASDGVVLTGTSTPGQYVDVTMQGVTHRVLTDANGNWVAPFAANEIAPGTYTAQITAQIVDSAGNTLTRTDSVKVDTEVQNFATSTDPVEGDNVINAAEASDGFTLKGTTEPGATVSVSFNGVTHNATVDSQGNWSVDFSAARVPAGEMPASATVNTTDAAGNTATTQVNFAIDTLVNQLETTGTVAGDGVVNFAEAAAGITLTGNVEPGSTVEIEIDGHTHVATVAANGSWTVDVPSSSIPTGTLSTPVVISAVDAAGNTASITETLSIDTEAPDTLSWTGYGRSGGGVAQVWTDTTADDLFLGKVGDPSGNPNVSEVQIANTVSAGQDTYLFLQNTVADGTHLVLASTDQAGNTSGAYLVTDDQNTNQVQMSDDIASALRQFNIDTIDLHFAEDSQLTITESQIQALSSTTDTVAIHGGSDDMVTITGATANGTVTQDGNTFNVFELGGSTVLIDDDITNVVI
ncbi:beta strand repeat-containing protein [Sagittula sp.]|uniref:beta strand repeat-containing protein n=1 Tax=Sagittula sp. TaxID=2038081 RepID=UPI003514CA78